MKICSLVLPTPDRGRLAAFYTDVLELPTVDDVITVGHTQVRLVDGHPTHTAHHFAFTIPAGKFDAAKQWLSDRVELLTNDGEDHFRFEPPFGPARSVYFSDPDGSVLELIAREEALSEGGEGFAPGRDVTGVGEVAIPVESVPAAVDLLRTGLSLSPILDGPEFAAVGDHTGMFIVVTPQRPWFPTGDRLPDLTPLTVGVDTGHRSRARLTFSNQTVAHSAPTDLASAGQLH